MSIFKNKIIKNFSVLTGTNLLIQVLSILSSIRLARQLQPAGYGMFNLVFVQVSIFSIIAVYGLRIVMIRHIARNREDARKIFVISNQIRILTTSLAIVIAISYNLLNNHQSVSKIFIFSLVLLIVFQTFWDSIESVFFGFEKMETSGFIGLIFTIIWIAEVYMIPNQYFTIIVLLGFYVFNQITRTIIYFLLLHRKILSNIKSYPFLGFSEHKDLIRQSNYYFLIAVIAVLINQVPILLLQLNSTIDQIGLFNLGNRILSPLQMMLSMLETALFPMFARIAIDNKELFAKRVISFLNIIILTGIWGSLCFALFSYDIVHLLYGKAYSTSANVILIQCWFTVMFSISCTIGMVLNALDKQKLLTQMSVIYAITSAPVFFIGTKFGAIGLASAFVIAAFLNMTYQWVIFRNLLQKRISILYSFRIFFIIGMLALGTAMFKIEFSIWLRLAVGLILSICLFIYIYKIEYLKLKIKFT